VKNLRLERIRGTSSDELRGGWGGDLLFAGFEIKEKR
jgi:hypothetical protein